LDQYFVAYKPFQVLSQFTSQEDKKTLKDFFRVPQNIYPVGRLDYDSEGLLVLTNDKQMNHRLLNPSFAHEREYWVQVEGNIEQPAVDSLERGVDINLDGKIYRTQKCQAGIFSDPPRLPERNPPIRYRKHIPTNWIWMVLREGKNRQVRKMTAKLGYPTLRLVRYRIVGLTIDQLMPGEMIEMKREEIYENLFEED
jgi:23S rRNA pseudouridine2457 synthase